MVAPAGARILDEGKSINLVPDLPGQVQESKGLLFMHGLEVVMDIG